MTRITRVKLAACALALLSVLSYRLAAALQWEQKEITVNMAAEQDSEKIAFPFKNTGKESVGIMSVDVSCPCLKFEPINGEYKAGTGGVLNLQYLKGSRGGSMAYKVKVHTTDPDNPVMELKVNIAIAENFMMAPGHLFWMLGSPAGTKEIHFRDIKKTGVKPVVVYSTSKNFKAAIEPRAAAGEYAIKVTAVSTETAGSAYIYIDVASPKGEIDKAKVMVAVRDPLSKRFPSDNHLNATNPQFPFQSRP
jgi:hypothetical protein